MSNPTPMVFVVDDDVDMLRSVLRLLRAHQLQTFEFKCARDFLAFSPPDGDACMILDVNLPDLNGLRLHEQIAARQGPPVIFITGQATIPVTVRAMKAGAVDFLEKPFTERDLLTAVGTALRWHHAMREDRTLIASISGRFAQLTPREREVMSHVVSGQLNKQIAFDLGTAEKTVKVHRARVMEKMGVLSVAELVRQADRLTLERSSVTERRGQLVGA